MSDEIKNRIVPKLRFPEFKESGEWCNVIFSEYGETVSGLSGKAAEDFGKGKPFVTYMQVFSSASIDLEKCGKVKIDDNEKQNVLQRGDVLITTSSETPEEVGFASVILDTPNQEVYLNSFCFAFRPYNLKVFNPNFSCFLFCSPIYRKAIGILAQGSTRFNISKSAFLKLKIPIPKDEKEQQKIADCLSSLDDVITAETQKFDALKVHKKGLMQQLFPAEGKTGPKLRFAEFRDSGEWIFSSIEEIASVSSGGTPSRDKAEYWNGEIPWISTTLIDFTTINTANEFITEMGLQNSSTKIFDENTILIAMYGQG